MLILDNAKIYTLDTSSPLLTALHIQGGRVVSPHITPSAPQMRLDLGGRTVLPGLVDAHLHLEQYALFLQKVDCETSTRQECLDRVAARAQQLPPGDWLLGHGWNQNSWAEGFGDPRDLDRIAPGCPVYLTAKSLHAAWANSAALRLANITAATPDPPGGRLSRDASGAPTGILYESAMGLVESILPEPTLEQVSRAVLQTQSRLWEYGLTGVHDFDQRRSFAALQLLHQAGALRLRVVKSLPLELLPHAAALGLRSGFGDDFLRIGSVKTFADGALGPQTAAMLQPYQGSDAERGMLLMDAEELFEHGRQAAECGLSLAVHAIGDRANHEVLNAFSQLRKLEADQKLPHLRHRIEHVQLLHPDDAGRLAQLGVIASMQPIHAASDMHMADRYWGERSALAYAWRTQLEHGAWLAFGSDAPVESPNPFWGLHAAVTRRLPDGAPGPDGWYPQQRLALEEAWKAYTIGAAYAAGMENRLGRLSPGYLADLVVLDDDPFLLPAMELRRLQPAGTMVGGEWVYRSF